MSSFSKSSSSCSSGDENIVEQLRRGPWTTDEDNLLVCYIAVHGEGRWNNLAKCSGLKRNGKSCRLRWLNYLKPDVKRGNLTLQEQLLILELHSKLGNRWSKIAQHLPGRTDNEIKNYWRTRVQKQAKHLNIDSNSTKFKEMIRFLWMPRLLEKIHRSSPSAPTNHPLPQFQTQTHRSLDHDHTNSSSELLADCSLDQFTQFPQVSQVISESPIIPFYSDDYDMYVDMESAAANVGKFIEPMWDCLRETNTWIHEEVEDSLWNMDELWELQEREN